jgi:hypothetical protein
MLYDLPEVIAGAPAYLAQAGVAHRVEVVSGSFFDGVPVGHDYYLLKNVLHDRGDHECGVILRHVANAIKPSGRLLVAEMLSGPPAFPVVAAMDLGMMVLTRGGRERSRAEFERLLHDAGFELRPSLAPPFSCRSWSPSWRVSSRITPTPARWVWRVSCQNDFQRRTGPAPAQSEEWRREEGFEPPLRLPVKRITDALP